MDPSNLDRLETMLKALASGNRLHLLLALQQPKRVTDLTLQPTRGGTAWGKEDRPISRQAVRGQIKALEDIGVVTPLEGGEEQRFVVNHAKLFEVTEQLRELATVRPEVPVQQHTRELSPAGGPPRTQGAHLVLVRGVREGQAFPLVGSGGAEGWLVGRAKAAEVPLDYDPFVSSAHARILARDGRHLLADLRSKNRTFLNWQPLAPGAVAPLEPGDVIGVGMSLLLYRR